MFGRKSLLILLLSIVFLKGWSQKAEAWADSVLNTLSEDEKIAQLIMVRLSSIDLKTRIVSFYDTTVERDILKYNIGGICLFQGAPVKQAALINKFQSIAKTPIMMAIDGENGVGMRLDSVAGLPRMMTLGALKDSSLVYQYGQWVGEQCRQLGLQINFAPVADVNNNPNNPVINDRSFGENKEKVATLAIQYMLGMKSKGIMGSAKHFPGHGDVDVDSHHALPIINKSRNQLDSLELYPFKKLFAAGIGSAMVGHLFIPSVDSTQDRASSISEKTVTDLLKKDLGFTGITFTDALEMKGVAEAFPDGQAGVESLIAGNDMLCLPGDVETVIGKIKLAILSKRITRKQIEDHARKVLLTKYEMGLSTWKPVPLENLTARLNEKTNDLKKRIAEKAITLAKYEEPSAFPIRVNKFYSIQTNVSSTALIHVGKNIQTAFASEVRRSYNADVFQIESTSDSSRAKEIYNAIQSYENVIIALHEIPRFPANNFGISPVAVNLINSIALSKPATLFVFGNAYAAKSFCNLKNIMVCYDDDPITHQVAASMLRGEVSPAGELPVSVCPLLPLASRNGFQTPTRITIKPTPSGGLQKIDSIVQDAIARKAAPGMALMVMKDGKIVHEKTYGSFTYSSINKVTQETVFDMASVTKICATTLSIMKLYDEGKLKLNQPLGNYLPWVRGSNKENILIKDILLHEAGLKAWIPFYKEIADSTTNKAMPGYFSKKEDKKYGIKVDDSLYMRTDWRDTMFNRILTSEVDGKKAYVYSDNDFIFLGEVVKALSGKSLDQYAWDNFYRPLGFGSTGFNPTRFIQKNTIAPTEQEPYFRERLVQGYVHDPGAAMFGGVSGHAGLFSNAYEIAVLMQLVLNKGEINGKRFISSSTIDLFTGYQSTISRRGLGFDKPEKDNASRNQAYPALAVSLSTFGHTGFTGTCAWADPKTKLVFVLHANRVHPEAKNTFGDLNVRGKVMDVVWNEFK